MSKKKTGISRRRAITIASAAAATSVLPAWTGPAARAATTAVEDATAINVSADLDWGFQYIALRVEPAWEKWREAAAQYERHVESTKRLHSSDDMDEMLEHRIQPEFVALDMASRKVRRLLWLANTWTPHNEAERAIQVQCERHYQEMVASEAFEAMRDLSCHIKALEGQGHRAKDHRLKRQRQTNLQAELSEKFEKQFGGSV